jgi:hypothetical protein
MLVVSLFSGSNLNTVLQEVTPVQGGKWLKAVNVTNLIITISRELSNGIPGGTISIVRTKKSLGQINQKLRTNNLSDGSYCTPINRRIKLKTKRRFEQFQ